MEITIKKDTGETFTITLPRDVVPPLTPEAAVDRRSLPLTFASAQVGDAIEVYSGANEKCDRSRKACISESR